MNTKASAPAQPAADSADPGRLKVMANAIRVLAMDAVERAGSGHPGLPMGAADVATVLFTRFLKFDARHADWPDRDRFVLSAGHGSMLLYALLYLLGYEHMTIEELKNFRQLGSRTPGHPEYGHTPGVETTTGPLGQGLANAVGMAIAERHLAARFGSQLVDHFTYALAGDGCLMEGISQEAIALAGHQRLGKLIVLFDDNAITIDGPVSLADDTDQLARFAASRWHTQRIDGHDFAAIEAAISRAREDERPSLIACRTIIGFGAPHKQNTAGVHGAPLGGEEIAAARAALGWDHPPFDVPSAILDAWRLAGLRGGKARTQWLERLHTADAQTRGEFERRLAANLPAGFDAAMNDYRKSLSEAGEAIATRRASQGALEIINAEVAETIGGSADLTGSNNTLTRDLGDLTAANPGGRYIRYGIREHAMAAVMNGLALHGGVIPYGGTFLVFSDYCRAAIRLSALMGQRVIYVLTHDSIGLGEDGPTHQPVEHLAALRAIPGLKVYRPADAVETAECWQLALADTSGPSVLALSRQTLPPVRLRHESENRCREGAYELAGGDEADAVIFASGSEVHIALATKAVLEQAGRSARVVSAPCLEAFAARPARQRARIVGTERVRVVIEAGIRQGWCDILRPDDVFIGMEGFGASAPCGQLYEHFGITAEKAAQRVLERLGHDGEA